MLGGSARRKIILEIDGCDSGCSQVSACVYLECAGAGATVESENCVKIDCVPVR